MTSWFSGGVRVYRVVDPPRGQAAGRVRVESIGSWVPALVPGNPGGVPQINHVIVDERGLIYAVDRLNGGLYLLRYTGPIPLN